MDGRNRHDHQPRTRGHHPGIRRNPPRPGPSGMGCRQRQPTPRTPGRRTARRRGRTYHHGPVGRHHPARTGCCPHRTLTSTSALQRVLIAVQGPRTETRPDEPRDLAQLTAPHRHDQRPLGSGHEFRFWLTFRVAVIESQIFGAMRCRSGWARSWGEVSSRARLSRPALMWLSQRSYQSRKSAAEETLGPQ